MDFSTLSGMSIAIYILVLSIFIGIEVISKVPTLLHTPLMSGSNAISGIILVGAISVAANQSLINARWFAYVAVFLATINAVGGFVVTDRMLSMFTSKKKR